MPKLSNIALYIHPCSNGEDKKKKKKERERERKRIKSNEFKHFCYNMIAINFVLKLMILIAKT